MSDQNFSEATTMEEKAILKQMKAKSNTGLAESAANKEAASKEAVAKLFQKMNAGELSESPVTNPTSVKKLEEAIPVTRLTEPIIVAQQLNRPVPTSLKPVNMEHEPTSISWKKTSVQEMAVLYPKAHAVSDLYMVLHGATQQPGFAFGLIAPHGTRYLIKADESGNLYMAEPNPNPAAFANIGLNPDFDSDAVDDKYPNSIKPFYQNSHQVLTKYESNDEFNVDTTFNEKLDEGKHDTPTESLTNPKVKDIVSKLRAEAAKLRGEQVEEPRQLIVAPAERAHAPLMEDVVPSFTLKKLNTMLYKAQDRFNNTGDAIFESIADELSTVIAEALLSNKTSIPKNKISKVTRSAF
jgi:hypothetical protein